MTGSGTALQRHGYHALRVRDVVVETEDSRSFVLEVPEELRAVFAYRAGQFCSFRMHDGEEEQARCYSMSSAPEVDTHLVFTVKRVVGGAVSNWLVDHVVAGSMVELNPPSGHFTVREGERPIIAFCGGSGITPVLSIAKSVLAGSSRPVSLLYANRDRSSIIFEEVLERLQALHPGRFDVLHHLDVDDGFVAGTGVTAFVDGRIDADFYVCGPGPFMDRVESALVGLGVAAEAIAIERFETLVGPGTDPADGAGGADGADGADRADGVAGAEVPEEVVVILRGKKHRLEYRGGDTVLETARRAGVSTPSSCEAGSCATCMALLVEGAVTMRVNDVLTPEEVEEGWVLTCQSLPRGPQLTVEFEPL